MKNKQTIYGLNGNFVSVYSLPFPSFAGMIVVNLNGEKREYDSSYCCFLEPDEHLGCYLVSFRNSCGDGCTFLALEDSALAIKSLADGISDKIQSVTGNKLDV